MFGPSAATSAPPTRMPTNVPSRPRTAFWPVLSTLERSTDKVPSTTQNECCTPVTLAMNTARASATAARTLLCSQTECTSRWAAARCQAADSVLSTPAGWRPSTRSSQVRRSASAAWSMLAAIDPDREAHLLGPETGVERVEEPRPGRGSGRPAVRWPRVPPRRGAPHGGQRRPQRRRIAGRAPQQVRPALQYLGRGQLQRAGGPVDRLVRAHPGRLGHHRGEPAEFVDQPDQRAVRGAEPGRPVRGGVEVAVQGGHRLVGRGRSPRRPRPGYRRAGPGSGATSARSRSAIAVRGGDGPSRSGSRTGAGQSSQIARTLTAGRQRPAGQPGRQRRHRGRQGHGQDERQQQRRGRAGQHRADHAAEQDDERDHRRGGDGQPGDRGRRGYRGR